MKLDSILKIISKLRSLFSYILGYFMGVKVTKLKLHNDVMERELKKKEDLYEVLRRLDLERHKRRIEYDRVRKERGDKPYVIDL